MSALRSSWPCRIPLWAGLLAIAGCGGAEHTGDRPQVEPVSGVVTYQNQAVQGATVTFRPQAQGLPSAFGKTDAQGRFRLQTFEADDGAVPGEHRVTIVKFEIIAPDVDEDAEDYDPDTAPPAPPAKSLIPEKYGQAATSGLSASVVGGEKNEFPFDLED